MASATLWRAATLVAGTLLLAAEAFMVGARIPVVVVLPWLVIAGWYFGFRASSYYDLGHAVGNIVAAVVRMGIPALKAIVGKRTWSAAGFVVFDNWAAQQKVPDRVVPSQKSVPFTGGG